jgi:tetratricopeptide (TPR) repeat protein
LTAFENAKIDEALKLYDQAIKLDPSFREAYLNRGLIYKYKGEWDKAIADFDQGVKYSYGEVASEIYFERGFAQIQKKNFDASITDFTTAIARAPTRTASDVVQSYALRAEAYMNKREYAKAASDLNFVIELNPQSSYAYLTRGRAKYEQQDAVGAIADYTKAISLNPKDPRPYFMRGFAYGSLRQYKEAKVDLEEAIRLDPEITPLAKPPLDFVNGEIAKGK